MNHNTPVPPPLVSAHGLSYSHPGRDLFAQLSFDIRPGLTLVQGGDGRGKSTLMRMLAGQLAPQAGSIVQRAVTVFNGLLPPATDDQTVTQAWLTAHQQLHVAWDERQAAGLAQAFGLHEHLQKPLFMLSTGSRRKLGLVAAAASGAQLTLIDSPYAGLDAAACRVLTALLLQAAADAQRGWVMADHQLPAGMQRSHLVGLVDLGD